MPIILFILIIALSLFIYFKSIIKNKSSEPAVMHQKITADHLQMIKQHVSFYQTLNEAEKIIFENEVEEFLGKVTIVGIDTEVEELDKILVASSAVIPLFAFPEWFYPNIITVELYKDAFNHDFETTGANRRILGMVGGGVMNGRMALSQKALRLGFNNTTDKRNTAIHEFVHLIDKSDGAVDGVPEILMDKHQVLPWLEYIREQILEIKKGDADFDAYGGTNETEFFAVAAEYFFERPALFEQKHPELFQMMSKLFRRTPVEPKAVSKQTLGRNDPCFCGSGKNYKNCHGAAALPMK